MQTPFTSPTGAEESDMLPPGYEQAIAAIEATPAAQEALIELVGAGMPLVEAVDMIMAQLSGAMPEVGALPPEGSYETVEPSGTPFTGYHDDEALADMRDAFNTGI